jgi:hypothetical protein
MLPEKKTKLASLALAGALAVGFAGAASAQDWSQRGADGSYMTHTTHHHHAMHYRYSTPQPYEDGYQREGYYRGYDNGYDGYGDAGPVAAAGAVVGSAVGAAGDAAAVATGYPYGYGYDGPRGYYAPTAYDEYDPHGSDWWGPYHNQYENDYPQYPQYQGGYW